MEHRDEFECNDKPAQLAQIVAQVVEPGRDGTADMDESLRLKPPLEAGRKLRAHDRGDGLDTTDDNKCLSYAQRQQTFHQPAHFLSKLLASTALHLKFLA